MSDNKAVTWKEEEGGGGGGGGLFINWTKENKMGRKRTETGVESVKRQQAGKEVELSQQKEKKEHCDTNGVMFHCTVDNKETFLKSDSWRGTPKVLPKTLLH